MIETCIKKWKTLKNEFPQNQYEVALSQSYMGRLSAENKKKWKKLVDEFMMKMKKLMNSIKQPEFTAYNCHRSLPPLKVIRGKMLLKI